MNLSKINLKSRLPLILGVGIPAVVILAALAVFGVPRFFGGGVVAPTAGSSEKFAAKRDTLIVKVTVNGTLKALKQVDMKCYVKGGTTIKAIVPEGTPVTKENLQAGKAIAAQLAAAYALENGRLPADGKLPRTDLLPKITDDDIKEARVLVLLDTKKLDDQLVSQISQVINATNALTQAEGNLVIQVKQNDSDIRAGQLNVKFARMDLEKYLGAKLTEVVLKQPDQAQQPAPTSTPARQTPGEKPPVDTDKPAPPATPIADNTEPARPSAAQPTPETPVAPGSPTSAKMLIDSVDFTTLVASPDLGGEGLQQKRILESDINLAKQQLTRSQNKLNWTKQLLDNGYVTGDEYEADKLEVSQQEVSVERTGTALDLFLKYGFVKDAQKLLSSYIEAQSEMERIKARTDSKRAQVTADRDAKDRSLQQVMQQLKDIIDQIEQCTIVPPEPKEKDGPAPDSWLVVYGGGGGGPFGRQQDPIAEGANMRESQVIISLIPRDVKSAAEADSADGQNQAANKSQMLVNVQVNESSKTKVKKGQEANIKVGVAKNLVLKGIVNRIKDVPDSQTNIINPDLKVYSTEVSILGSHPELMPGMSAEVEIIAEVIPNALVVPVSAIYVHGEHSEDTVCYVVKSDCYERRPVLLGSSNESYVQIKDGLKEGEEVLLREPHDNERVVDVQATFVRPQTTQQPQPATQQGQATPAAGADQGSGNGKNGAAAGQDSGKGGKSGKSGSDAQSGGQGGAKDPNAQKDTGANTQQPNGAGGPPDWQNMTPEQQKAYIDQMKQRAVQQWQELMKRFNKEEQDKINAALPTDEAKMEFARQTRKMNMDEKEKYIRDNILNK
jgi:hypothetical protein